MRKFLISIVPSKIQSIYLQKFNKDIVFMLKAKKGRLLISEPSLTDATFFKSVILLTHHNIDESIGLVLNQPTNVSLNEILNDIPLSDFPVYIGGPVANNSIQFIHTLGKLIPKSRKIMDGLYWGGDFEVIIKMMTEGEIFKNDIRFFAGYSGWGIEQLNNEIREESWILTDTNTEFCMQYASPNLWSDIIKTQHRKYAIWANIPKNPNLN